MEHLPLPDQQQGVPQLPGEVWVLQPRESEDQLLHFLVVRPQHREASCVPFPPNKLVHALLVERREDLRGRTEFEAHTSPKGFDLQGKQ